jgi:hypothetical protein
MAVEEFRRIALAIPGAVESSALGYFIFCIEGKSFATIEGADNSTAVVRLTRNQQATLMERQPAAFVPVPGYWARWATPLFSLRLHTNRGVQKCAFHGLSRPRGGETR